IDEFISSGEQKWGQKSSVVLLLPHGYEGQGPDHSSARIERFLSLCAQDNMTVALPTTPANYFHLLRWQALSGRHKPLIVFTPKSLLRLKAAASATVDFTQGSFRPLIGEPDGFDTGKVRRVVLCAGKIYYDLAKQRAESGVADTAIVRMERLYPIPRAELQSELSRYPADVEIVWAQEEPENQGAWPRMALRLPHIIGHLPTLVSLPASSAPAFGSAKVHAATHKELVETAIRAEG
ncbi:MAG: multifunctional oxoglutarate decarboxylase/oxoglutarate dehydrogenase thiamine pyrophosphate-binding subunit/dihydrolipoyllysine-residue succinyltransferase subunit, partial [Trebonia sp.]